MSSSPILNRRDFLKMAGATGASLVLGVRLETASGAPDDIRTTNMAQAPDAFTPNAFLAIYDDNSILVRVHRSEMGQGVNTSITMILADELEADWSKIRIEQAPPDGAFGDQVTGGSRSISGSFQILRGLAAIARTMLVTAAAQTFSVDPSRCYAELGFVVNSASGERMPYGDLVSLAATLDIPKRGEFTLKEPAQFRYIGQPMGNWDGPDIVTGRAQYASDVSLPGMVVAVIARPPVIWAEVVSYDDTAARAVEGVRDVCMVRNRVVVIADDTWSALQGREALDVTWSPGNPALSSSAARAELEAGQDMSEVEGSLKALYHIPYLAHATMEPMVCVADVRADSAEIWAPTQDRMAALNAARNASRLPQNAITLHVPLIGGGFGRRLQIDYVTEAVMISREIGHPVKLFWTREEDMQNDYYHPFSVSVVEGKLTSPGLPSVRVQQSGMLPTGAWRSVENFTNAYPTESFVDEIAAATGRDPVELRLALHAGTPREAVIRLAAEKANWGDPLPQGWGRGMAVYSTFGVTHVAQVVEVEVSARGEIHVHRVVCAVDCGTVVNPDGVIAQMEGGIIFGLTAALKAAITVENGRIQQSNFSDYPLLRYDETPLIEVYIVESDASPSGVGEMGVPPVAPAVANAVFAATGKRVRHLPIRATDLV
jgi:isoquinoline 1-oxidoreductase beta subunit